VNNCLLRAAALCVLLASASLAAANEAQIRRAFEAKLGPNHSVQAVSPGPMPGIWEVVVRSRDGASHIVYADSTGSYLIQGNIVDLRSGRDVTEDRLRKLLAVKLEDLPLDQAVKVQRGNGRRILVMFSDPYCPYCQKFEKTLQQVDDITVYVFMYPVIRPQAADHSIAVWCSSDRAKAWLDLAIYHKPPAAKPDCDNPVEENIQLGRRLGVSATPTLMLANGERVPGGLSLTDLKSVLDKGSVEGLRRR
jgi:thiol:disulfide interchange protein DsbC